MAKKSNSDENEHHVVGVRIRVTGIGNLQLSLVDLDDARTEVLVPIPMALVSRIEPLRLANFQSQRIRIVGKTTELGENFRIHRIIAFGKPVAMEYPA